MPADKSKLPVEKDQEGLRDEQTEKRIHEHLSNKNDQISEQDISKVKTNVTDKDGPDKARTESTDTDKKDKKEDDESTGPQTVWNILE